MTEKQESGAAVRAVDGPAREPAAGSSALSSSVPPNQAPSSPASFVWTSVHTIALTLLCVAAMLETLDITIVNVALPSIQDDLGFSQGDLPWVVNAYTVAFGGFLLLGGRTGDVFGQRRIFVGGIALFLAGSLAAGLSQDAGGLVATRALQGLAGAFSIPMTLAMIASIFPAGPARNKALAVWGTAAGVSSALGVVLGGVLVNGPGWRWIFLLNVPVCALILAGATRYLPVDRTTRSHRFDVVGALVSTGGTALLIYGVLQASEHEWGSGRTIGLLAGAGVLLAYFVVHELFVAAEPLMTFSLFRNRSVSGANAVQALVAVALWAMLFFVTLYAQEVLHYSPLKTGLAYLPLAVTLLVAAPFGPLLVPKIGIRAVVAIGCAIVAGGLLLFTGISPDGGLGMNIILPSVVVSLGFAILFVPINIAAVTGVPAQSTGIAAALLNVSRYVGGSLGFAVIATLAESRTDDAVRAGDAAAVALTEGFKLGFVITAVTMVVGVLAALLLFREDGRGEKVDLAAVQSAAIEGGG
ncbi:MFS transporter [Parafrankia sp. EUN1f]|uniref:MFS transporter n=1 Tax=Parafrankia sp. EUN1f TaxID=102897 RepID=UPI0001C43E37|nr:MFS transporter [Parafrankia sp. EUN1f]EFC85328.1 drug resistance transporter, EmrB/QacA subfamily [Parafrankia sp. EUN1f]